MHTICIAEGMVWGCLYKLYAVFASCRLYLTTGVVPSLLLFGLVLMLSQSQKWIWFQQEQLSFLSSTIIEQVVILLNVTLPITMFCKMRQLRRGTLCRSNKQLGWKHIHGSKRMKTCSHILYTGRKIVDRHMFAYSVYYWSSGFAEMSSACCLDVFSLPSLLCSCRRCLFSPFTFYASLVPTQSVSFSQGRWWGSSFLYSLLLNMNRSFIVISGNRLT